MVKKNRFIAANWKMNASLQSCDRWLKAMISFDTPHDLALCLPYPYLDKARSILHNARLILGAQDCSAHAQGAYTGEVSTTMLKEFGCGCVIVGHSERRQYHQETDAVVAQKMTAVIQSNMIAIVCIGESLEERQAKRTQMILAKQIQSLLEALSSQKLDLRQVVIAYEPIWAIGTELSAEPQQIAEVVRWIRQQASQYLGHAFADNLRILYGGSVKPENAKTIFSITDIDGGLIGGSSLLSADFQAIVSSA